MEHYDNVSSGSDSNVEVGSLNGSLDSHDLEHNY